MARSALFVGALAVLAAACATPAVPSSPPTSAIAVTTTVNVPQGSTSPATTTPETAPPSTTSLGGPTLIVTVPAVAPASAPLIDGVIGDVEWADGLVTSLDDGSEVRFLAAGGYVFVAIEAAEVGSANLLVAAGDVVRVLHSSAALGSARYERIGGEWQLTHDFEWCCRSGDDPAGQEALLEQEGWAASIGFAGTEGHVEYEVLIEDGSFIALSYVLRDGAVTVWPADLADSARSPLYGRRRATEQFDFAGWAALRTRGDG